jgi:valyl-tRNA synthetase
MGYTPGNDARFSEEKVAAKRNFINKLWNISRFILTMNDEKNFSAGIGKAPTAKTAADEWILTELAQLIIETTKLLDNFEFSQAAEKLTEFTWDKLADWYLEIAKIEKNKEEVLIYLLRNLLILWHPFIPFVTEQIWQSFNDNLLLIARWPLAKAAKETAAVKTVSLVQEIVTAIRNIRSENKIEPSKKLTAVIYSHAQTARLKENVELISNLRTGLSQVTILEKGEPIRNSLPLAISGTQIFILGAFEQDKGKVLLAKEKERTNLKNLIKRQRGKLANPEFVGRAPQAIVAVEQQKLQDYQAELEKIIKIINSL